MTTKKKAEMEKVEDADNGKDGIYSTADLPLSGHDKSIDDDQQKYASKEAQSLSLVASQVKDKALSRRLKLLASKVENLSKVAGNQIGIREPHVSDKSLYTTADLPESGKDSDLSGKPIDADQKCGVLQFYDSKPPKKGEAGPTSSLDKARDTISKYVYRNFVATLKRQGGIKMASIWAQMGFKGADPTQPAPPGQEQTWPTYQNHAAGLIRRAMGSWQSQGDWQKVQAGAQMLSQIQTQFNNSQNVLRSQANNQTGVPTLPGMVASKQASKQASNQ